MQIEDDEKRTVSNTSTLSSIICVVAGTGILAISHALAQSGWIGLLFLISSACMSQLTGYILIQCLYCTHSDSQGNKRLRDYADIGLVAFGKPGQFIGWLFSQLFLFLTPTIYLIMASENIRDILVQNGFNWLTRRGCIWVIIVIVGLPFITVRNMRDVSFLSTFACMTTVCLLVIVCVMSMSSSNTIIEEIQHVHHDIAIPQNIPVSFSTFGFSYHGHVIYPHLESNMKHPQRWSKVLLVSTCMVSIMYFTIAIVCYLVYGNQVQTPIYKSLPAGTSQQVAMFVITLHVLLAIPFYLYILTSRIETYYGVQYDQKTNSSNADDDYYTKTKNWASRILLRMVQVIACGILAMFIPYFSDFMTLVSTLLANMLSFVLPTLFWMKLNHSSRHIGMLLSCFIIGLFGVFCTLFGTMDAIKAFIQH